MPGLRPHVSKNAGGLQNDFPIGSITAYEQYYYLKKEKKAHPQQAGVFYKTTRLHK